MNRSINRKIDRLIDRYIYIYIVLYIYIDWKNKKFFIKIDQSIDLYKDKKPLYRLIDRPMCRSIYLCIDWSFDRLMDRSIDLYIDRSIIKKLFDRSIWSIYVDQSIYTQIDPSIDWSNPSINRSIDPYIDRSIIKIDRRINSFFDRLIYLYIDRSKNIKMIDQSIDE